MNVPEAYEGREQSLVKHFILQNYLERFAHIVGSWSHTITYVDCFSGPWQNQAKDFSDTSFSIALNELKKARATHLKLGREIHIRCLFLEREKSAFQKLKAYSQEMKQPGIEIDPRNKSLEDAVNDIVDFCKKGGRSNFSFIFIDPTGWTGFSMKVIQPLLRLCPEKF